MEFSLYALSPGNDNEKETIEELRRLGEYLDRLEKETGVSIGLKEK